MTQLRGCFSYAKPGGGSDAGVCSVCVGLYNDLGGMMGWRDATLTPRSLAQAVSGCLAHPHIHSEVPCSNPLGRKIQAEEMKHPDRRGEQKSALDQKRSVQSSEKGGRAGGQCGAQDGGGI